MFLIITKKKWNPKNFQKINKNLTILLDLDQKQIIRINPKIIFFIHWSKIIPKKIFNNYLCIQFHSSDLPKYRGGSPIQHQILDGLKKTKITAFKINIKIGYIKFKIFKGNCSTISIMIHPKYQNLGLGSKLLLKSLHKISKYMNIYIFYSEILKKNKISLNFFKRNGFVEVRNKKNIKISFNKKNYLLIKKSDEKKFYK